MLRTNLSTRPFYNDRLIHALLIALAIVALALTAYNASRIVSLRGGQGEAGLRAERAEARAVEMNRAAVTIRGALKPKDLEATAVDAREVNDIIAGRTFSWTDLFNQLEKTLPDDVRILSITPRVERDGRMLIAMVVVARQAEDVDAFVSRLEATKTFARLLSHQETVNQEGLLETVLEGQYLRSPGRSVAKGQP
jgi:hypothetical protein